MKTLIIYASKYGCTADCAINLKSRLNSDVTVLDIKNISKNTNCSDYDTIIIGSSVYVGKIAKPLRGFCENNKDTLMKKRIGIFLCCALPEDVIKVLNENFPSALLKHASTTKAFGSEARLDKMSFVDKMIIKAFTKGDFSKFKVSSERIDDFAKEITS